MRKLCLLAVVLGVVDPNCTLQQICTPNYTKSVRPPASYTNKLKAGQMKELGLQGEPSSYEEDHVVPLELCGAPRDPQNLTPEPWPRARLKDVQETKLHRQVCAGLMPLKDAQALVVTFE